jgi:hypothetical protein
MRPALYYIPEASLGAGPSPREAEALRQARIAEVRSLLAEIAAKPCRERPSGSLTRDASSCCRRELIVA